MKKFISAIVSAIVAISAFSAVSLTAFSAADGGFTAEEIENSKIKPVISVPKIQLTEEQIKKDKTVYVPLEINGAENAYSAAEIWTYFDERLKIKADSNGNPLITVGNAAKHMLSRVRFAKYFDTEENTETEFNGIHFIGSAKKNMGLNGTLYNVHITLPDNAKVGDEFPIEIVYISPENTNSNYKSMFTNMDNNEQDLLMQAYAFTHTRNGYIRIVDKISATLYGDANVDGDVSASDSVTILQYLGNKDKYNLTEEGILNADVFDTGDGVTPSDALAIQMYDAGIVNELPIKN